MTACVFVYAFMHMCRYEDPRFFNNIHIALYNSDENIQTVVYTLINMILRRYMLMFVYWIKIKCMNVNASIIIDIDIDKNMNIHINIDIDIP